MLGSDCCANPPTLSSNSGEEGSVQVIGGFKSYVSGSPNSNLSILLISDVYGYEAPKLRKLADKFAKAGFYAVVPDFLYGDPYVAAKDTERPLHVWIKDHLPAKGCEDARNLIAALKSNGVSAIGAAGFCWGGMVVNKLAKFDDLQAGVLLHPGPLLIEDVNAVKIPIAILGAETDNLSPAEQLKQFGEILSAKHADSYVKIYPGVVHGWTVRYKDDDEFVANSAQEAHTDMLNWLTKYVK